MTGKPRRGALLAFRLLLFALLLTIATGLVLWTIGPRFLEQRLHAAGFPDARITLHSLGLSKAEATIRLDAEGRQKIGRAALAYSWTGFGAPHLETLRLEEMRLDLAVDEAGRISGLPLAPVSERARSSWIKRIELADIAFHLETPFGPGEVSLSSATVLPAGAGAFRLEGKAEAQWGDARLKTQFTALWEQTGRRLTGNLDLTASGFSLQREGISFRNGRLSGRVGLVLDRRKDEFRITPQDCLSLGGDALRLGATDWSAPRETCLAPLPRLPFLLWRSTGAGTANFGVSETPFALTLKPSALHIEGESGRIEARLGWDRDAPSPRARLSVLDMTLRARGFTAQGVNAKLEAARLAPLSLPKGQSLTAESAGQLEDIAVSFGLEEGRFLRIAKAEASWAGGLVSTAPFKADLAAPETRAVLETRGLDLGHVLDMAGLEGLHGEGRVKGRVPLRWTPEGLFIDQGALKAQDSGKISYDPKAPPPFLTQGHESTEMLLAALKDFRYDSLEVLLDGAAGGDLSAALKIRGANPEFYNGFPVSLNLNIGGALGTLLRNGLGTSLGHDAATPSEQQNR